MCHSHSLVWNIFQCPDSTPTTEQAFRNLGFGDDGNLSLYTTGTGTSRICNIFGFRSFLESLNEEKAGKGIQEG